MAKKQYSVDMVNGSMFKNVITFAIPLFFSNILQLMYNAADVIVVSRYSGSDAMASVGSTSSITNLMISLFTGLAVGGRVVVSRRFGARDDEGVHKAVHTSMLISVITGIISMIAGILFAKNLLMLMGTPEGKVLDGAVLYMKITFIGMLPNLVFNFGSSILGAVGDTRRPLYILAFSGLVNVILNLILVIRFNMSVAGVAIATLISNVISATGVVITLVRTEGSYRLYPSKLRIYKSVFLDVLKVGIPTGIQSSLFGVSNTLIQSTVNSFGTAAIAGNSAASNIDSFIYFSTSAFGVAAVTGVSQNYGAKNEKGIKKAYKTCAVCAAFAGCLTGIISVILAKPLLGIYITDSAAAIDYGMVRLCVMGFTYFLCGIMEVQNGMIRGLGYSTTTMITSLLGVCVFRVLWISFILPLHRTTRTLYMCWPISWVLSIILNIICYSIIKKKAMQKMYES